MTTIATHQPSYLVWPPHLEKMARSDLFVFLDDVQYTRNSEIHRNKVLSPQQPVWLSIPVGAPGRVPIREVEISDRDWPQKHLKTIQHCYGKAPYYTGELRDSFEELYSRRWDDLLTVNVVFTEWLRDAFSIKTPLIYSSELGVTTTSSQRILDICKAVGADRYLTGTGGLDYMQLEEYDAEGVEVLVQDYTHLPYAQQFKHEEFQPRMSAIDMLFNLGPDACAQMLRRGNWRGVAAPLSRDRQGAVDRSSENRLLRGREENLLSRRRAGAPSARQAQRSQTPPLPKPQLLRLDS